MVLIKSILVASLHVSLSTTIALTVEITLLDQIIYCR